MTDTVRPSSIIVMSYSDHYGFSCTCGAENFQRVVVERVVGRPVVTDLVACVECHIVFYVPLPPPLPIERSGTAMPSGIPRESPGLAIWGGVAPVHRAHEQNPEDLQRLREAAARANKSKRKR